MSLETLREFLGWCTVLNMSLFMLATLALLAFGAPVRKIHSRLMGLSDDDLSRAYFQYLAQYKIAVITLNFVPYLALRLMS